MDSESWWPPAVTKPLGRSSQITGSPREMASGKAAQCWCVFVPSIAISRAVISSSEETPRLIIASSQRDRWRDVITAWQAQGIEVLAVDDVRPYQWEKAILNATLGPLCLASGKSMAALWSNGDSRSLVLEATAEGAQIAAAAGIAIEAGLVERAAHFFATVGEHRPSVLNDHGELPWIFDPLLTAAQQYQLPCPALRQIIKAVDQSLGESCCASSDLR